MVTVKKLYDYLLKSYWKRRRIRELKGMIAVFWDVLNTHDSHCMQKCATYEEYRICFNPLRDDLIDKISYLKSELKKIKYL